MKRVLLFICLAAVYSPARILLVVDSNYYNAGNDYKSSIDNYLNDIITIDLKPAELIIWTTGTGTTRDMCFPLWQKLASEYSIHHHTPPIDDDVEGAIFIGSLPIPQFRHWNPVYNQFWNVIDTSYFDLPHDGYFMDLWNQTTNQPYSSDLDIWNYYSTPGTTYQRGMAFNQYFNPDIGQGSGYDKYYNFSTGQSDYKNNGDEIQDIWVSRIIGEFVKIPYSWADFKDPNEIILAYMQRAHARMTQPASVPSRSFTMSGIGAWGFPYPDDVLNLDQLHLPFHAVFQHPDNNPSNLQSQLQAGPRGNSNYGGYYYNLNESHNPNGHAVLFQNNYNLWSSRNCILSSLLNHETGITETNLDTLGYEWAGIYEHGCPDAMGMNGVDVQGDGSFHALNGSFSNYAVNMPLCDNNPASYQFTYTDSRAVGSSFIKFSQGQVWNCMYPGHGSSWYPNIWGYGPEWTGENALWKCRTPVAGQYDVYISYIADPQDNESVTYMIEQTEADKTGSMCINTGSINQQIHTNEEQPGNGWERFAQVTLQDVTSYDSVYVTLCANGNSNGIVVDDSGNYISTGQPFVIDAVKFIGVTGTPTAGDTVIVDNSSPDFSMNPGINRTYLEFPIDGGPSKTQFFLTNSCGLSEYNATSGSGYNNLGNLFAMLYNGLISMGTTNSNYSGNDYSTFINSLHNGDDFGQAYLAKASLDGNPQFILLGAGNLKSAPYIPYGTTMTSFIGTTVSTTGQNYNYPGQLIWLQNISVTTTGGLTASGKEIRIYAESDLKGEVDLKSGL